MTSPSSTLYQMDYQNPHAEGVLKIPVLVVCNTSDEQLLSNIKTNAAREGRWIGFKPVKDNAAIIVGGGPSVADHLDDIRRLSEAGGVIYACNAAATFLIENGITPHYQVIADAKPETATLVEPRAVLHLFASQVDPACFEKVPSAMLWHLHMDNMEDAFPEERRKRGGYALVGGGAAVGNSACALAYVMGYRTLEIFGLDSSHRGEASHAYDQPMNRFIPTIRVDWADRSFISSVAMKAQAEKFIITGRALEQAGCKVSVHGDGLLPTMWNTPVTSLSEQNKYKLMWQFDAYREYAPGEHLVETFLTTLKPEKGDLVVDFGCGTGRASIELHKRGYRVYLIDFADNCRDEEAMSLPFLEWDLVRPVPVRANYGLCTDVMEHIPPNDVAQVLTNILEAAKTVLFQISTVKDSFGALLGTELHLTVRDHQWWMAMFHTLDLHVTTSWKNEGNSLFIVTRKESINA
jgi:hypothetical protein